MMDGPHLVSDFPQTDFQRIGHVLRFYANLHFTESLGQSDLELSYESCSAAVAIGVNGAYPTYGNAAVPNSFSVVFGSSRLYKGLDPDFNAMHPFQVPGASRNSTPARHQHAEVTAIESAEDRGLNFFVSGGYRHLYVDFPPCMQFCDNWLRNTRTDRWYVHFWGTQQVVAAERKAFRKARYGTVMG